MPSNFFKLASKPDDLTEESFKKALELISVKLDLNNQRNIKAEYVKAEDERKSIFSS